VKINTVPVEAYRQTEDLAGRKNQSVKDRAESSKAQTSQKITLPAINDVEVDGIKASMSPSLIGGVLTPDEKAMLIKYFARFGDTPETSQIYSTDARIRGGVQTGMTLDIKG
jgi:hypothetical protein